MTKEFKQDIEPFTKIDESFAVLFTGKQFKQVDLYEHENHLYAKNGGGFLAIMNDGSTSTRGISCRGINYKGKICKHDKFGKLRVE